MREESLGETAREVQAKMDALENTNISVEARVKNGKYEVIVPASSKSGVIETVATSGAMVKLAKRISGGKMKEETKVIMSGVNLFLEEGKMYLVLGAPGEFLLLSVLLLLLFKDCMLWNIGPREKSLNSNVVLLTSCAHSTASASFLLGCGKSTLLKMIAGLLPTSSKSTISGSITVNGVESTDPSLVWSNIVAYVDQIDRLHGYLTVKETMQFAWDCRSGGTHRSPRLNKDLSAEEVQRLTKELDEEGWLVNLVLDAIGLTRVKDTFVGNDKVRGVSGGQRKRVTVGEMMCVSSQVQMFDEISTGLDGKLCTLVNK